MVYDVSDLGMEVSIDTITIVMIAIVAMPGAVSHMHARIHPLFFCKRVRAYQRVRISIISFTYILLATSGVHAALALGASH
jgi:hypothetical protein